MSKEIITTAGLLRILDDEFSWRRKELFVLKSKIPNDFTSFQTAILRATTSLLYAHWEGFVKSSMSHYLEHVSLQHLKHNELVAPFVTLSLMNKLKELKSNDIEVKTKIIEYLILNYDKRSNIPKKNIINTKSNLRYDVLQEILFILNLNDNYIESKKDLINDLVDCRNFIAHGEYGRIEYATFESFFNDVINLMSHLKNKIENSAVTCQYKNTSIPIILT